MTPERLLWQTVLINGLIDTTGRRISIEPCHADQARAWIGTRDFHTVCALAGMDGHFVLDSYRSGRLNPEDLKYKREYAIGRRAENA